MGPPRRDLIAGHAQPAISLTENPCSVILQEILNTHEGTRWGKLGASRREDNALLW
jgi:hypothetical protein